MSRREESDCDNADGCIPELVLKYFRAYICEACSVRVADLKAVALATYRTKKIHMLQKSLSTPLSIWKGTFSSKTRN